MRRIVFAGLALPVLLILLYVFVARPYHVHWGATAAEVAMDLPGDQFLTDAVYATSTRAVTIHAPAPVVWSWLVQIGQGRGGWYSYTWLENLFGAEMENVDAIVPSLQALQVGDPILYTEMGLHATVALVDPGRTLALEGGWSFNLLSIDSQTTRLIVRYPAIDPPIYYYTLLEPAHFVMESGMLLGIKQRAEAGL